jgi:hypothetical protein
VAYWPWRNRSQDTEYSTNQHDHSRCHPCTQQCPLASMKRPRQDIPPEQIRAKGMFK